MKKLVLILSGGGAKGAFQVGAWNSIQRLGINFEGKSQKVNVPHAVFGISAGALNGAMIAMGKSKELYQIWNQIAGNPSEVFTSEFIKTENNKTYFDTKALGKFLLKDLSNLDKLGLLFEKKRERILRGILDRFRGLKALADNSPLFDKIKQYISLKDIKSEHLQVGSVSLTTGAYCSHPTGSFSTDLEFQKAVLASSAIPLVFPPVESIKQEHYELSHLIDGGMRNVNPLGDAVRYVNEQNTKDEYYFLIISTNSKQTPLMSETPDLFNLVKRSIYDIAMDEVNESDLSEFLRVNVLVKQAEAKGVQLLSDSGRVLKSYKVKIIQPQRELGSALNFSRSLVMDSYLHGFQTAKAILENPLWD